MSTEIVFDDSGPATVSWTAWRGGREGEPRLKRLERRSMEERRGRERCLNVG